MRILKRILPQFAFKVVEIETERELSWFWMFFLMESHLLSL